MAVRNLTMHSLYRTSHFCVALVGSMVASLPSSADVYCGGDTAPTRVLTYSDGSALLYTTWRSEYFQICNLNQKWKGVEPAVCFEWMSKVAGAINAGKRVGIWYGGLSSTDACRNLPTYSGAPAPVYIDVAS